MRVLVTGANGFVGASVCRALIGAGHTVRALVRPGARDEDLPAGNGPHRRTHLHGRCCHPGAPLL